MRQGDVPFRPNAGGVLPVVVPMPVDPRRLGRRPPKPPLPPATRALLRGWTDALADATGLTRTQRTFVAEAARVLAVPRTRLTGRQHEGLCDLAHLAGLLPPPPPEDRVEVHALPDQPHGHPLSVASRAAALAGIPSWRTETNETRLARRSDVARAGDRLAFFVGGDHATWTRGLDPDLARPLLTP